MFHISKNDLWKRTTTKLDYTCRARWPEGLLCVRSHIVQIECARKLQPVSRILHLKYGRKKSKITLFRSHIVQKCTPSQTHRRTRFTHLCPCQAIQTQDFCFYANIIMYNAPNELKMIAEQLCKMFFQHRYSAWENSNYFNLKSWIFRFSELFL